MNLIFHIDVNSAYLSWSAMELLAKDPSLDLRTIPSIIGGDEKRRHGIVLAKSIPAKKYGIHTGEPVASALRKCPTLRIEPPDHRLYSRRSHELMELLHTYTSDIEQVSIDECYLAYTPISHRFDSPQQAARQIADRIRDELGFTVNVGIAPNKLLAKMASDFEKPDRVHTLFPEEIPQKMWPLPVEDLFMVGRSSAHRLIQLGIRTIGDLAHTDPEFLQVHFKSHGQTMWEYANGIDNSPLKADTHELKGVGNSTTLASDVTTAEEAREVLLALAEQVAGRLRRSHQIAQTVTVEIKYNTFQSCSRQTQFSSPNAASGILYEYACRLFDELWNGTPIRLLGIRTSKLLPEDAPVQLSLFDLGLSVAEEPAAWNAVRNACTKSRITASKPPDEMSCETSSGQNAGMSRAAFSGQVDGTSLAAASSQIDRVPARISKGAASGQTRTKTFVSDTHAVRSSLPNPEKQKKLDRAMDQIRERFGQDAVMRGSLLKTKPLPKKTATGTALKPQTDANEQIATNFQKNQDAQTTGEL